MTLFSEIERMFYITVAMTLSLILLAHLYVHIAVKRSNKRYVRTRKAKSFNVRIASSGDNEWCSLYIGKTLVVKPFYNSQGERLDWLYTVIPCRKNKRVLSEEYYLRTKYENPWGITLSVGKENVEVVS